MHIHPTVGQTQKGLRPPAFEQPRTLRPRPTAFQLPIAEQAARQPATTKHVKHYGAGF